MDRAPGQQALTRAECTRLLRSATTGWLVFSTARQPRMVLVNIAVRGDEVLVRTGPGDAVDAAAGGAVMVVGASATEVRTRTGWSVTVAGPARLLDPDEATTSLRPWAPGVKDQLLGVRCDDVSGRRVVAGAPLGDGVASNGWWG